MADGDGWAFFLVVAMVAFAGATAGTAGTNPNPGSGGGSGTSTTTTTSATSPGPGTTNIPGGAFASCPGTLVYSATEDGLTLRIFYSPQDGGLNCSSVTRAGSVGPNSYLATEIRVSRTYPESNAWPDYAAVGGGLGDGIVDGAYVTGTNELCVTANGKYFPANGEPVAIVRRLIECG